LELQGKFDSKPIFFIALLLLFFPELQKQGPRWQGGQLLVIIFLSSKAGEVTTTATMG
jgi:hypothetical protein